MIVAMFVVVAFGVYFLWFGLTMVFDALDDGPAPQPSAWKGR